MESGNNSIKFSFLQISDLRLGSASSLSLHLSPSQRQQRLEESLQAMQRSIEYAREKEMDAILIPGNLFDMANVTAKTVAAVQKIFASASPLTVFITPGATDPISRDSFYLTAVLNARGLDEWPNNVVIFTEAELKTNSLPDKPNVRISGLAIHAHADQQTQIPALADHDRSALNILLYPLPGRYSNSSLTDTEFSELIGKAEFSYTASSGPLNQCRARREEGRVIAACTGTFSAQSADETGARVALAAELMRKLPGRIELDIEPIEFDQRRIINLKIDLSTIDPSKWITHLDSELVGCGIREEDILLFELSGTYPAGQEQNLINRVRQNPYFHCRCSDKSRPDYLANLAPENKIEHSLIDKMNQLFAESSRSSDEQMAMDSEQQHAVVDDALYFALEALREGKITLRNAD